MSSRKQSEKKPYCKVCHDAGKPESVFTSHYVKTSLDANAKIACPTLLALECKYCFNPGHTVKYCAVLKKNEKAKRTEEFKKTEQTKPAAAVKKPKNAFASLCDESSDDDKDQVQVHVVKKEEFPQLNAAKMEKKMQKTPETLSFASVAYIGQAKEEEKMLRQYEKEYQEQQKKRIYQVIVPEPRLTVATMNWAELSDSDSSDDDF